MQLIAYLAMAAWLIFGGFTRLIGQTATGTAWDPLPFISLALGAVGVLALLPVIDEWWGGRE